MVPFSYFQGLINSRVMKKHSPIFEVWTLGASDFSEAWRLQLGTFVLSCLPYCNSGPSFLSLLCACVSAANRPFLKTQKRLNEPNSKNANTPLKIDDFTNFDFFKK